MLHSHPLPGQGGSVSRSFTLRSPILFTCCNWENDEVGEKYFQLCSLLSLFLRIPTILLCPFKILCRAGGSLLSSEKTNVCILPFKTVMALINWIATMPGVTIGQGLWHEHAFGQSGNCCIMAWKIPLIFCFSYPLCWYSLDGILKGRKKIIII